MTRVMQGDKLAPTHSTHVSNIISAPLDEGLVDLFLTNLADHINRSSFPSLQHVQILLYLTLHPTSSSSRQSPLDLLNLLLEYHPPRTFAPSLPTISHGSQTPRWMDWQGTNSIERSTLRMLGRCKHDGVWGLVLDRKGKGKEDDSYERTTSERGWDLLRWLIKLWTREEKWGPNPSLSLFTSSLARPSPDLLPDDARAIVNVVLSAFDDSAPLDQILKKERQAMGLELVRLLSVASTSSPPQFLPSSFPLTMIDMIRRLSVQALPSFLSSLSTPLPSYLLCHIYTVTLEDFAGVRAVRSEARRKRKTARQSLSMQDRSDGEESDLQEGRKWGAFPPPTIRYLVEELLLLRPPDDATHAVALAQKSIPLTLALLGLMMTDYPPEVEMSWRLTFEQLESSWETEIDKSLAPTDDDLELSKESSMGSHDAMAIASSSKALLLLLKHIKTCAV